MGEIIQAENLQLVTYGEASPAAERDDFTIGGRIPINPSGGLECKGHPISASGIAQIHELVTQPRGEAGNRQVESAKLQHVKWRRFVQIRRSGGSFKLI